MKTADTIEEQEERKAARGDKTKSSNREASSTSAGAGASGEAHSSPANTPPAREKQKQRDPSRFAAWKWKPGQSGNPSGRADTDIVAMFRAVELRAMKRERERRRLQRLSDALTGAIQILEQISATQPPIASAEAEPDPVTDNL